MLALLLAALGTYQYLSLRSSLIAARVSTIEADLAVARARAARPAQLCSSSPLARAGVATAFARAVGAVSGHSVAVAVFDRDLDEVGESGPQPPPLDPGDLTAALAGSRTPARILQGPGEDRLVVGIPVRDASGRTCGVAEVTTPTTAIDTVLSDERRLLLGAGGATVALALVAGLLLTRRTLAPLSRLTETAGRLAAGDLGARSHLSPRLDEVGTLARTLDDMAGRIEAAFAQQAESEARTRRFIADASHELRTPVTALKGYIDVLRRGAAREPQALEAALGAMGREAERMRGLVLDLLTLARLDSRRPASGEVLDLNAALSRLLDEGVDGMHPAIERRLAPEPLEVRADPGALDTIVRNLLGNACTYAPGARQVWSTSRDGEHAVLSAHDEGPGIDPEDLPHVFERFYRGAKTRAREEGGSGLGLSIVQGLARAHGGDAAAQSEPGGGTTIVVRLPLARPAPP